MGGSRWKDRACEQSSMREAKVRKANEREAESKIKGVNQSQNRRNTKARSKFIKRGAGRREKNL